MSLTGLFACGTDNTSPAPRAPAQLYWALELNQHAIMLALTSPYDTVQLTATPRNVIGAPITTTGTVSYQALDSAVSVSPTGLVTAHYVTRPGQLALVTAALQDPAQGITHVDTALIVVTATPASPVVSYSLQPLQGDSAKRALDFQDLTEARQNPGAQGVTGTGGFDWPVRAVDATGASVCGLQQCGLLVYYHTSNPRVALIDPHTGHVAQRDTGHVVFTAQTLAYGQVLRDSVAFQIGYQLQYYLPMVLTLVLGVLTLSFLAPKKLILGLGAVVTFCSAGLATNNGKPNDKPVDIVFDHPEAIDTAGCGLVGFGALPPTGSGNIAPFGGDTTNGIIPNDIACRRFNTPGVYHYHSTLFPSDTYEIDVQPDPQ